MKKINFIFLFLIFVNLIIYSGNEYRETRAIWVTTNFALDWPPDTYDEEEQKSALRKIFKDISEKKFNTVYFQVRSNGTVLYNSNIEPFSPYLKGEVGAAPNYDPLKYAIELGREFNLDVHAWVNMVRCFSGSDDSYLKHPQHVRNKYPELTSRVMEENGGISYWMNPGYYKAQDYLVDILLELTSNYDIDGVQLDFFRYPGSDFEDTEYFKNYDLNMSIGDWRRNNLTSILRKFKEKVKPKNPYLKIGATPIGIRHNLDGAVGWEGYSSAYQDTETWLKEGLVDYLAPQIYWDFANNPRFDVLAEDWVDRSYNKNIVIGLAAYKNDVKKEIPKMINFSRKINSAGISLFRYGFMSDESDIFFDDVVFPAEMPWKINTDDQSNTIISSSIDILNDEEVIISWNDKQENSLADFRSYILLLEKKPVRFFPLDRNKLKLKFGKPAKLVYNYQICKLDRLWNYHSATQDLEIPVPYLYKLKRSSNLNTKPKLHRIPGGKILLSVYSPLIQKVAIDFFNIENAGRQEIRELGQGINYIIISENLDLISKIKISFQHSKRSEELNFFN